MEEQIDGEEKIVVKGKSRGKIGKLRWFGAVLSSLIKWVSRKKWKSKSDFSGYVQLSCFAQFHDMKYYPPSRYIYLIHKTH